MMVSPTPVTAAPVGAISQAVRSLTARPARPATTPASLAHQTVLGAVLVGGLETAWSSIPQ
jgi:hypothetical protein